MVNYYVISKNEKAVGQGGETLYGVCACTLHDGVMEVQNCIYGIRWKVYFAGASGD